MGLQSGTRLSTLGFPSQRTGSRFFLCRICTTPPPHLFPTSVPGSWVQTSPFLSYLALPSQALCTCCPPAQIPAAWIRSCLPFSSCRSLLKCPLAASLACPPPDPSTLSPPPSYTCRHILSAPWGLRAAGKCVLPPAVSQSAASARTGLFVARPWSLSHLTTWVFSGLGRWVKWRLGAVVTFLLGPLTHRKLSLFCCSPGLGLWKAGVWQRNQQLFLRAF